MTAAVTTGRASGTPSRGSAGRIGRLLASPSLVAPLIVLVAVTALWQAGVFHALFGFKTFTVPYPSAIVGAVPDSGEVILDAVGVTLQGAFIGYAVGMTLGFLIGSALVRFVPGLTGRVLPLLSATNALPIVAVAPLVSLFTGPGVPLKVIVVTIMTAPVMTVYTVRGLREVDPTMLEMMASLDATPGQVYRMVQVRTALPFLFTALKSSVVLALIGTIVSEAVRGFEGLGWVIVDSIPEWRAPKGWLALIVIATVGIAWYVAVEIAERVVLPWEVANRRHE